jgi:hypothetical protein
MEGNVMVDVMVAVTDRPRVLGSDGRKVGFK